MCIFSESLNASTLKELDMRPVRVKGVDKRLQVGDTTGVYSSLAWCTTRPKYRTLHLPRC